MSSGFTAEQSKAQVEVLEEVTSKFVPEKGLDGFTYCNTVNLIFVNVISYFVSMSLFIYLVTVVFV